MKLANLLDQNKKSANQSGALKDSLGDGFLIANNLIFRNIRTRAVSVGFRFSTAQNDAYRVLPLSQLDSILKTKTIPYFDNVTVLEQVEARMPRETVWDDISDNLKGNSVFHEACHAVSRSFVIGFENRLTTEAEIDPEAARVLASLLEESFANTCELLSIMDASDQVHRIFIELNSYVYMLDDRVHLINASRDLGAEVFFKFVMLMYLHSNFLRELNETSFERSLKIACQSSDAAVSKVQDPKLRKSLRQIAKIAYQLNPRFREVTTRFYLRLNGVRANVNELNNFDFLSILTNSQGAKSFLESASAFAKADIN